MGSSSSVPRPDNWVQAPDVPDVPIHELIFSRVEENLQKFGDGVWLKLPDTGKEIKFSEVVPKVKTVASALTRRGFKKGDFLIFYATNKIDYFVLVFAVWMCGGAVSLMNPESLTTTLAKVANETEAVFIACDNESIPRALDAKKTSTSVRAVISLDNVNQNTDCVLMSELYNDDGTASPNNVEFDTSNDIAYMPYSSGTTGLPKGVMHTFRSLTIMFHHIKRPPIPNLKYQLRSSIYHISGMIAYLGALLMHLPIIGFEYYDEDCFYRTIEKERPTVVYAFVSQIVRIMKQLDLSKYDLSSIAVLGVIGSGIHPDWEDQIRKRLPNLKRLVQGYGLSETFIVTGLDFLQPSDVQVKGTLGKPLVFADLEVHDPESGKLVPDGQIGELWVKTSLMMKGYWKNPEATEAAMVDGWYRTGDSGYKNEEGYFFFVERLKELIKCDNYRVVPQAIEGILHLHPAVADVALIGQPHEMYGEIPVAFVVKKTGIDTTREDILNFINSRVAQRERIREVVFIDSIPRNFMAKIVRRDLLAKLKEITVY